MGSKATTWAGVPYNAYSLASASNNGQFAQIPCWSRSTNRRHKSSKNFTAPEKALRHFYQYILYKAGWNFFFGVFFLVCTYQTDKDYPGDGNQSGWWPSILGSQLSTNSLAAFTQKDHERTPFGFVGFISLFIPWHLISRIRYSAGGFMAITQLVMFTIVRLPA